MITDSQIENLINPLIKKHRLMELDALRRFGEKIKEIGEADSKDSASLFRISNSSVDGKKLQRNIEDELTMELAEIYALLLLVAEQMYLDSQYLYEYKNIPFLEFNANQQMTNKFTDVANQVNDLFTSLFKFPAFLIRDLRNPQNIIPTSIEDTYKTIVDECIQATQNPNIDYYTVMKRTEEQLVDSGLNSVYYSDDGRVYHQNLESAVRNNILDGIKLVQQGIQDTVGEQVEADGKELSAHLFSAPDHEPFQGHQFTNENWDKLQSSMDFEDVDGQAFAGVDRIIGVWNCRHFAWSIIVGQSEPIYTKSQLQSMIEQNNNGYDLPNGKHLTMYECTQRQRQYEFRIRKAKAGIYFARMTGDDKLQQKYEALLANRMETYKAFSDDCGLPTNDDRLEIITK